MLKNVHCMNFQCPGKSVLQLTKPFSEASNMTGNYEAVPVVAWLHLICQSIGQQLSALVQGRHTVSHMIANCSCDTEVCLKGPPGSDTSWLFALHAPFPPPGASCHPLGCLLLYCIALSSTTFKHVVLLLTSTLSGGACQYDKLGNGLVTQPLQILCVLTRFWHSGTHEIIRGWSDDFWQERISPINGRTGKANRIHWHNHCSPTINDAEWSPEEETELLEIAQQHYHRNVSWHGLLVWWQCMSCLQTISSFFQVTNTEHELSLLGLVHIQACMCVMWQL